MKKYLLPLVILMALWSCTKENTDDATSASTTSVEQELKKEATEYIPGTAVVKFDDNMISLIEGDVSNGKVVTKSMALNQALDELGITSMERMFPNAGEFEPRTRAAGLHKWYIIKYQQDITLTKADDTFSSMPGVEYVEGQHKIKLDALPFNDPQGLLQWQYQNTGSGEGWKAGADINVVPVWNSYTTGNPDVIVSVVDGGIDQTHEDLVGNLVTTAGVNYNFVTGYEGTKIYAHEHGTHVAGTIAAVNNNGIGVCGVAGGNYAKGKQGVKLMSCQIFMADPNDPSKDLGGNSERAIKWGADHGAVISQNSWGYDYEKEADAKAGTTPQYFKDAVDYFNKYAGIDANGNQTGPMDGGLVIFAAGNDAWTYTHPADYDGVITVGSIDPSGTRAYYSNYGSWCDIAAPGGGKSGTVLSTLPGNKYGYMQGTSMACPHVSGVAALIVSFYGGKGFTRQMLVDRLLKGANSTFLSSNNQIGPLVDALGSMTYGNTDKPSPVSSYTTDVVSNTIKLTWKVTGDSKNRPAYGFLVLASKSKTDLQSASLTNPAPSITSAIVLTGDKAVGDEMTGTITGLDFSTPYFVTLAAYDYSRNFSAISNITSATTKVNNPPTITTDYTGSLSAVKSHQTIKIPYNISDPDGHKVDIKFTRGSRADSLYQDPNNGQYILQITGSKVDPGTYTYNIVATDPYLASVSKSVSYTILPNHAPAVIKEIDNMLYSSETGNFQLDMSKYIQDPDGESLTFKVSYSNNLVVHLNAQDNTLYGTVLMYGFSTVTITGYDAKNASASTSFKFLARDPGVTVQAGPNPVINNLYVRTGSELENAQIKIISATGATIFNKTMQASAFEPANINMGNCAPGRYTLKVSYGNVYKSMVIVKK